MKIFSIFIILLICVSCNSDVKDTSELYAKSQSRDAIIERSGTTFRAGSDPEDMKIQMQDAQNRLRAGGGLLGKKPADILSLGGDNKSSANVAAVGLPINPYLWRGSLETISFMPLMSADPFAGIIITEWYTDQQNDNERCKLNIFVKGVELKTENLSVSSFCQNLNANGNWVDQKVNDENNTKLENAILNKAKKLRLSQS
ncbi:MAG: hypothetical protein CFH19_00231 [Alphaproteobacteria bacterium MarineAlpha5_Bin9]|nr:MAG: hypothetical protein CFH19_00231 [Alphaproteobacteria bacterium MarineAlpha5_Bin9]|tara:strand:+ start:14501 stop:15103 length:603 start_codon:yes stop_codon:yes gene_type:complete